MTKQERLLIEINERSKRQEVVLFGINGDDGLLKDILKISDRVLKIETSRKTWGIMTGIGFTVMTIVVGVISASIAFFKK